MRRVSTATALRALRLAACCAVIGCRQTPAEHSDVQPTVTKPTAPIPAPAASAPQRRALADLVNTTDPGWPVVAEMVAKAKNPVEVLPVDPKDAERALLAIQVTTRSPLGAIAYASGGLLVDHGWIRVLGGGSPRLPRDIGSWNLPKGLDQPPRLGNAILVADDALGGFFALNGGAFAGPLGHVFYLAPDTLRWEDLRRGYTDFLQFLFKGDLAKFYRGMRWRDWSSDAARLSGDRAYMVYPFLWAKAGGPSEQRSRKEVPIEELWSLFAIDLPKQLADVPDGGNVQIKLTE
ncbi:MAG TPA: DUF2625 domain-containing protein [Polyangiaceae bacterium]|jgi:hypothetical protein